VYVDFEETRALTKSWNAIIKPAKEQFAKDLKKVNLFENVGAPWPRKTSRHKQISLKKALTIASSEKVNEMRRGCDQNLRDQHEESQLLDQRHRHFIFQYRCLTEAKVKSAFKKLCKREEIQFDEEQSTKLYWSIDALLDELAWQRLHSEVIDEVCLEMEYQALLAGYLPTGPDSSNWKKCRFLFA